MKLSQRRLARPSLGGLMATRQGSLTLALVCAICAAGVLTFALGRYKTSLKPAVQQATVLVSTGLIHKGMTGTEVAAQNLYKSTPVATTQVTPGALSDAAPLAGETAQVDILPGQQLTAADFSALTSLNETLPKNQRAVAVSIGESPGITDALQAGEHVDIYALAKGELVLLDADVLVLKAGTPAPVRVGGQTLTGSSMLLAIQDTKVSQVIYAAQSAGFYLSLRPLTSSQTPPYAMNMAKLLAENDGKVFGPPATANSPSTANGATP